MLGCVVTFLVRRGHVLMDDCWLMVSAMCRERRGVCVVLPELLLNCHYFYNKIYVEVLRPMKPQNDIFLSFFGPEINILHPYLDFSISTDINIA